MKQTKNHVVEVARTEKIIIVCEMEEKDQRVSEETFEVKFEKKKEDSVLNFITFSQFDNIGQVVYNSRTKKFIPYHSGYEASYYEGIEKDFPYFSVGEPTASFENAAFEVLKGVRPNLASISVEKKTSIELEYRSSFQIEDYSKLDLSEFE